MYWAIWPAGLLGVIGGLLTLGMEGAAPLVFPALILFGGWLISRSLARKGSAAELDSQPAPTGEFSVEEPDRQVEQAVVWDAPPEEESIPYQDETFDLAEPGEPTDQDPETDR